MDLKFDEPSIVLLAVCEFRAATLVLVTWRGGNTESVVLPSGS